MASSYKLELDGFSTSLRIQDRAERGKGMELHGIHILGGGTPLKIQDGAECGNTSWKIFCQHLEGDICEKNNLLHTIF